MHAVQPWVVDDLVDALGERGCEVVRNDSEKGIRRREVCPSKTGAGPPSWPRAAAVDQLCFHLTPQDARGIPEGLADSWLKDVDRQGLEGGSSSLIMFRQSHPRRKARLHPADSDQRTLSAGCESD